MVNLDEQFIQESDGSTQGVYFDVGTSEELGGGYGILVVDSGGQVQEEGISDTDGQAIFGDSASDEGSGTVTGTGSELDLGSSNLLVGNYGFGFLTISNGGAVDAGEVDVGAGEEADGLSGGSGTITVDGINSSLNIAELNLGGNDQGLSGYGALLIENGATVVASSRQGSSVLGSSVVQLSNGLLESPSLSVFGEISGSGTVSGLIYNAGQIIAMDGTLDLTGELSGTFGGWTVADGAVLEIDGSIDVGVVIQFGGTSGVLSLGDPADALGTIIGYAAGDTIDLNNDEYGIGSQATLAAGNVLQIPELDGGAFALQLDPAADYSADSFDLASDGASGTAITEGPITTQGVACFLAGTSIATGRGQVAVEALVIGDEVRTRTGCLCPIKWIGHRRIVCRRHSNPHEVFPVRIHAHAFGHDCPRRDLWLSPEHSVFDENVLIPIKCLINGMTIVQETWDEVTYWHVELERHDVISAEGLPCESYLDNCKRSAFANGGVTVQLQPNFAPDENCEAIWEAAGCAPIRIDSNAVARVAARLRLQARKLGFSPARKRRSRPIPPSVTISDLIEPLQPDWYLPNYPDVAAAGIDAVTHYANWGRREGRLPCPEIELVRALGLVDLGTLPITMPDVVAAGVDPVEHFCRLGWRERRRPNPYFETGWYLDTHDVPDDMNPLLHYVLWGENQGLAPSRHFDPNWYRRRYAIKPSVSALAYHLKHRRTGQFSPLPGFDLAAYTVVHAATLLPNRDPYAHFLAIGRFAVAGIAETDRLAA